MWLASSTSANVFYTPMILMMKHIEISRQSIQDHFKLSSNLRRLLWHFHSCIYSCISNNFENFERTYKVGCWRMWANRTRLRGGHRLPTCKSYPLRGSSRARAYCCACSSWKLSWNEVYRVWRFNIVSWPRTLFDWESLSCCHPALCVSFLAGKWAPREVFCTLFLMPSQAQHLQV